MNNINTLVKNYRHTYLHITDQNYVKPNALNEDNKELYEWYDPKRDAYFSTYRVIETIIDDLIKEVRKNEYDAKYWESEYRAAIGMLNTDLDKLNLSVGIIKQLKYSGILTIEDLKKISFAELAEISGISISMIGKIAIALEKLK